MNTIARWMLVPVMATVMMAVAAPAFSAQASQMFACEQDDDTSEAELKAQAEAWLKAARGQKGGAGVDAYVHFPVAVNSMRDVDFFLVVVFPSFEQFGVFWDNYNGSPAAAVDKQNDASGTVCPDSALWEVHKVKAE
jgi:hypothetical protein